MNEKEKDVFKEFLIWLRSQVKLMKDTAEGIKAYTNVMLEEMEVMKNA